MIGIMRTTSEGVLTVKPTETLEETIPKLNKVSGLPVIGDDGKVVGVISRKVRLLISENCFPPNHTYRHCFTKFIVSTPPPLTGYHQG